MRTMYHAHACNTPYIRVRTCKPGRCVYALYAHVRTHDISSRIPASERASERALACGRESQGKGGGEHTGDVIPTKGRNNIGVDLLKSRLFLARVPLNALPFWYFERPSRNRVDFSTGPLTDKSVIKEKTASRMPLTHDNATSRRRFCISQLPETY